MCRALRILPSNSLNRFSSSGAPQVSCFREERDVLVNGDRRWITQLHFAFQDENYLVSPGRCPEGRTSTPRLAANEGGQGADLGGGELPRNSSGVCV